MGRKIPGRKHHGVRDPEKQRIERLKGLKYKINAPPTNPDDQHVPQSLKRLQEVRDKMKSGEWNRRKPKSPKPQMFTQNPRETDKQFLFRINGVCEQVRKEAAFQERYNVEVQRDESGEVVDVVRRAPDPIKQMMKDIKREKKKKKGKKGDGGEEPRLTKSQKRTRKLTEKKRRKKMLKNQDSGEVQVDTIQFGEQVHAPPTLTAPKRSAKSSNAPRPGKKDLLLKSLMGNNCEPTKGVINKVIDKKGKRKDLPNALRRQLEKQQLEVIEAYKTLKADKR